MNFRCDYCFKRPSFVCCQEIKFCADHQSKHFEEGSQHSFQLYSYPEFNLRDLKLADNLVNRINNLMECKKEIFKVSNQLIIQIQKDSENMINKINNLIDQYYSLLNKNPQQKDPSDFKLEEFVKKTLSQKKPVQNLLKTLIESISNYFSTEPYEEVERYAFKNIKEAHEIVFKDFNLILQSHKGGINSLMTSFDNKFILTSDSSSLKIWNKEPLVQIKSFQFANISKASLSEYTYDKIFIGNESGSLFVIDTKTWSESFRSSTHLKKITKILQLDEETLLTCSQDSKIKLTNLVKSDLNSELPEMSHAGSVNDMSLFNNKTNLISICSLGFIKLWDLSSRSSPVPSYHRAVKEKRTNSILYSCAVIKHARVLIGTNKGTIQLWNLNLEMLAEKTKHAGPVFCIQASPDENEFLTAGGELQGGRDYAIRKWKISSNLKGVEYKESFNGHVNSVTVLDWKEDAIFSGSLDKALKTVKDRKEENFPGHSGEIRSIFVSLDGQFIVSADSDDVFIWRSISRRLEVRACGLRSLISCIASKKILVFIASHDKSLLGFNMNTNSRCFVFKESAKVVNRMMITNDLKFLVTVDDYQVAYFKIEKNRLKVRFSSTEKNNKMTERYPESSIMFNN